MTGAKQHPYLTELIKSSTFISTYKFPRQSMYVGELIVSNYVAVLINN